MEASPDAVCFLWKSFDSSLSREFIDDCLALCRTKTSDPACIRTAAAGMAVIYEVDRGEDVVSRFAKESGVRRVLDLCTV